MKSRTLRTPAVAALAFLAGAACRSSQARRAEPTGFLGSDAQLLQKEAKGQATLRYETPGVDWAGYASVLIEPVEYWADPGSKDTLGAEDKKKLTDRCFNALEDSLSKRWTIARQPGPG